VVQFFYLRTMLQHMDPSRVIPDRVRTALDTLAEGLLVLDKDERIVLANKAFAQTVGKTPAELQGSRASELPWSLHRDSQSEKEAGDGPGALPWAEAMDSGSAQTGVMLKLDADADDHRTFLVNCTPILGDDGVYRGVLSSFDDVTPLEQRKAELARMLDLLKVSSEEIRRQNEELEILATRDPLTGCLNRRAFFQEFDKHWSAALRYGHRLSCVMVDVDHFKSVNDNHGHAVGDLVLQKVAGVLKANIRDSDHVCRYGGEEFCVLLPHTDLEAADQAAERFRRAIETTPFEGLSVTASLGASCVSLGASSPQTLLDQADKCLYVAKRNGRNQVVRWDNVPEGVEIDKTAVSRTAPAAETDLAAEVPFHAVTALISALAYRDLSTAEHSRRVADLCVIAAEGIMSLSQTYILEMGALLHDIGKVGVPDSILLKPGPLTQEEWTIMHAHDRIGVEIIRASFASEELSAIVENHHAFYGGSPAGSGLPSGDAIPIGARILTIADAFDAMVSDRVYRKGRSHEEAYAELRRCAGSQFDPELVERFIHNVSARNSRQRVDLPAVSKETALSIGLQIERLAVALDNQDLTGLKVMASRLNTMAAKQGVTEIADQAAELQQTVSEDADLLTILETAGELLELCRSTQRSYLRDSSELVVK
jgi:diguanylate cyclase (GGDEF)-like protein/putative nucleotidyltransferase with HDIG domain